MGWKSITLCFAICIVILCAGCPDYSHLRPVPDYANMTDGGGEITVKKSTRAKTRQRRRG